MNQWNWRSFGYGAIGAAAPEIIRFAKTFELLLAHPYLIVISIAFVVIGGVFATAWGEEHPLKCIYLGATFPIWVSAWSHG